MEVGSVVDEDERGRLGECAVGVPGVPATPGAQGGGRPALSRGTAFLHSGERALACAPKEYGHWNSVRKRFDRLSKAGVFEAFLDTLGGMSPSAHLIQMFDSTIVRAHVSAAGEKGGKAGKPLAVRAADSQPKFHAKADGCGDLIAFDLTVGEASDCTHLETLLDIGSDISPRAAIADKGYSSKANRATASKGAGHRPGHPA